MAYEQTYIDIPAGGLLEWAAARKTEGWQFVQLLAAMAPDEGVDVVYTVRRGPVVENATVHGVEPEQHLPSVTGQWLAAFVFENEIHDLFGVQIDGIAIDFGGKFYDVAVESPMTVLTPAQVAAREKAKAARDAAAQAASAAPAPAEQAPADAAPASLLTPEQEAKLAAMDPEKAAKARAVLEAKAAKAAAAAKEATE